MVSPDSAIATAVVDVASTWLPKIIRLGNGPSKRTLGFLPDAGFVERARRETLLAAVDGDNLLGYLLYDLKSTDIKVVHLCVAPSLRRGGIARTLMEAVSARHSDHLRVVLTCRVDYDANGVWKALGLRPVSTRPGRSKAGSQLTTWVSDHGHASLFDSGSRPLAALDHNVFLDLHLALDRRAQAEQSRWLTSDWIGEEVELCVTDEVFHEINRINDPDERSTEFAWANSYRLLPTRAWDELVPAIERVVPNAQPSDHRHVARAATGGAQYLVSRDEELLKNADALELAAGIRVMSPAALIVRLDRLRAEGPYRPVDLEGTTLTVAAPSETEHRPLLSSFLNHGSGERVGSLREHLAPMLADTQTYEPRVVRSDAGQLVAAFVRRPDLPSSELRIPFLRLRPGTQAAASLARQLVFDQREVAARHKLERVVVTDPHASPEVLRALEAEGFSPKGGNWSKSVRIGLSEARDDQFESPRAAAVYEHENWPVKVLGAGVPSYLVPIKVAFAEALLDPRLTAQLLFARDTHLALTREHVYYRSSRNSRGIDQGARILWYVTGQSPANPRPSIRAISQVAEVKTDRPLPLFSRHERFGVYTKQQVIETASKTGKAMAIRFVDTEPLEHPPNLDQLRLLWAEHGESFVPPLCPSLISERMFEAIYRGASSYAR